jgi:redox-sensitive bicupin YhaK (pirin superfamily)
MKYTLHKAATRGHASHGWLESWHTFSFAGYHDPQRVHFGALRVLNDDRVAPGMGFGRHPHENMEIISIPLEGDLEHADSIGNKAVIRQGDVQVMSAGTGIIHSEQNASKERPVKFLQIWVIPRQQGVAPRYDQQAIPPTSPDNPLTTLVSPIGTADGGVQIHQDAWFHLCRLGQGEKTAYSIQRKGNGVYVFLLSGDIRVNDVVLNTRDGLGVTETEAFTLSADTAAEVLLMEVPMAL